MIQRQNWMGNGDSDELLQSFTDRHEEADPKAREVLDEFIRITKELPPDSRKRRELVALNESWRDTLSDSEVIKHLRALHPNNAPDGRKRRRLARNRRTR
jgi:hypothetical protein